MILCDGYHEWELISQAPEKDSYYTFPPEISGKQVVSESWKCRLCGMPGCGQHVEGESPRGPQRRTWVKDWESECERLRTEIVTGVMGL